MKKLTIETKPVVNGGKTRRFSAILLAYITANHVWDGGRSASDLRPVYLSVTGKETTLRPFLANLRAGKKAVVDSEKYNRKEERIEILRSAGYEYFWQRMEDGVAVVTCFLPELFVMDPGMIDPKVCRFVSAPPIWWANRLLSELGERTLDEVREFSDSHSLLSNGESLDSILPRAVHFCLYVDRRTRRPLVSDCRFYLQLYKSALAEKAAIADSPNQWGREKSYGIDDVGLCTYTVMNTTQELLDSLLSEQIKVYHQATRKVR